MSCTLDEITVRSGHRLIVYPACTQVAYRESLKSLYHARNSLLAQRDSVRSMHLDIVNLPHLTKFTSHFYSRATAHAALCLPTMLLLAGMIPTRVHSHDTNTRMTLAMTERRSSTRMG